MTGPLSLLRRERGQRRPGRTRAAFACAVIALAAPAAGNANSLRPDPAPGSISAGLQPDAFHGATTAATAPPARTPAAAVLPVRDTATLPAPAHAPVTPLVTPPVTPKVIPAAAKPNPTANVPPRAPVPVPVERLTLPRVVHGHAKVASAHVAVRHHAAARLQLPTTLRGSITLPTPTAPGRRDLLPAALALLALVATSGCFLAVAARSRQDELEV
jgi:hypothetical protein